MCERELCFQSRSYLENFDSGETSSKVFRKDLNNNEKSGVSDIFSFCLSYLSRLDSDSRKCEYDSVHLMLFYISNSPQQN